MKKIDQDLPAMCDAHARGDLDAVRKLLEVRPALEKMGPPHRHTTWLHLAASEGQIRVVDFGSNALGT